MAFFSGKPLQYRLFAIVFALYSVALVLFTFFPRPVLETGDPSAISEFLRTHANFFYKILYANASYVAFGNYLMLTPFILLARIIFQKISLTKLFFIGVAISAFIEISQIFIPGRVSDIVDFASNVMSLALGVILLKISQLLRNTFR